MSDTNWIYIDSAKQKRGPVSEEDLLKLLKDGQVTDQTFVWRSEMPDWKKIGDVSDLKADAAKCSVPLRSGQSANLLTQRANASSQPAAPLRTSGRGAPGGMGGFVKVAAAVVLIIGGVWANNVFHFMPGSNAVVDSDHPDRWFSADNREGAIMQCTVERKGRGKSGGVRYRLTATVSAGVARGRRLPIDNSGYSQVVIRDSAGNEVFNQPVSNAKLCPT